MFTHIIGLDEVGYGPFAGPMIVCAARVPADKVGTLICRDSKSYKNAAALLKAVSNDMRACEFSTCVITAEEIDRGGYVTTRHLAFQTAFDKIRLSGMVSDVIVDGDTDFGIPRRACFGVRRLRYVPKADLLYRIVGAASCKAKLIQLAAMDELDKKYPRYGFSKHHGYGTPEHTAAIKQFGAIQGVHRLCMLRRKFFAERFQMKTISQEEAHGQ